MYHKRNKKKLLIAIILAIVAGLSVYNSMNSQKTTINTLNQKLNEQQKTINQLKNSPDQTENGIQSQKIVVAKQIIKAGTKLTPEMLELKEYAPQAIPQGSVNSISMLSGQIVAKDVPQGNPVIKSETIGLQTNDMNIPTGMRAITIPVNYVQGLSSFITVGSKIDIISVKKDQDPEFVLQGVHVISLEGSTLLNNGNNSSKASAITLLVPVGSISRLVDTMIDGKLQIVARGISDNQVIKSYTRMKKHRNINNYSSVGFPIPAAPPCSIKLPEISNANNPAPVLIPKGPKVEVIQANVKSEVNFNSDL